MILSGSSVRKTCFAFALVEHFELFPWCVFGVLSLYCITFSEISDFCVGREQRLFLLAGGHVLGTDSVRNARVAHLAQNLSVARDEALDGVL